MRRFWRHPLFTIGYAPFPFLQEQQQSQRSCVSIGEGGEVMLRDDVNASRAFRFDHCFDSSTGGATQVSRLGLSTIPSRLYISHYRTFLRVHRSTTFLDYVPAV